MFSGVLLILTLVLVERVAANDSSPTPNSLPRTGITTNLAINS